MGRHAPWAVRPGPARRRPCTRHRSGPVRVRRAPGRRPRRAGHLDTAPERPPRACPPRRPERPRRPRDRAAGPVAPRLRSSHRADRRGGGRRHRGDRQQPAHQGGFGDPRARRGTRPARRPRHRHPLPARPRRRLLVDRAPAAHPDPGGPADAGPPEVLARRAAAGPGRGPRPPRHRCAAGAVLAVRPRPERPARPRPEPPEVRGRRARIRPRPPTGPHLHHSRHRRQHRPRRRVHRLRPTPFRRASVDRPRGLRHRDGRRRRAAHGGRPRRGPPPHRTRPAPRPGRIPARPHRPAARRDGRDRRTGRGPLAWRRRCWPSPRTAAATPSARPSPSSSPRPRRSRCAPRSPIGPYASTARART